jgi:hypothetical protein
VRGRGDVPRGDDGSSALLSLAVAHDVLDQHDAAAPLGDFAILRQFAWVPREPGNPTTFPGTEPAGLPGRDIQRLRKGFRAPGG